MTTQWPEFKSNTITFKNREDFISFIEIKQGFDIVDIGWSDCIINFEDEENRNKAFELMTGKVYNVKMEDIKLND